MLSIILGVRWFVYRTSFVQRACKSAPHHLQVCNRLLWAIAVLCFYG
ncbi:hypothetical protein [Nostoc sp. T09]|nr:hypothetical protein [Nostoc sp. T09]